MATGEGPHMTEDRRALLTEREREILLGNADVTDKYRGVVVSRVRNKIQRLDDDLPALEKHDTLADELREVVCSDGRQILCPVCGEEFDGPNNAIRHMAGATTHGLDDDEIRLQAPDWWSEETPNYYFSE